MTDSEVKKLMCMPHTDEGNAERLRYMFGKTWKYLPRYKSWLHWDGHSWKGQSTTDLRRAITDAFQQLALAIYALPVTADTDMKSSSYPAVPSFEVAEPGASLTGKAAEAIP